MIVIAVLLIIFCFFMAFRNVSKEKARQEGNIQTFESLGFIETKRIRDLVIDENSQKWMLASSKKPIVHDFSDIASVEITENGERYTSQHGIMRAVVGGTAFGAVGALVGAGTAKKSQTISHLSVDIMLNNLDCPIETVPIITSAIKTDSLTYQKAYENTKKIASTLMAMQRMATDKATGV